jgi:hypothetical protein
VEHDQDRGELTASVTNLDTSLTNVNGDDFPHGFVRILDVREVIGPAKMGGRRRGREIILCTRRGAGKSQRDGI